MYYEAEYHPNEKENLSDKADMFIGRKIAIQELGQLEIGKNKKQVFYTAVPYFGMIPNYDLKYIKSIPYWRWIELSKELQTKAS